MFGSTMIDVAIGLVFIFFILSMIASHINEMIAGRFKWRSKDLHAGIHNMLSDPDLATKVLNHSLITSMSKKGSLPSYIPPNTFAMALFDALAPAGNDPTALETVRAHVLNDLPDTSARQALLSVIDTANGDLNKARKSVESWFNDGMDRLSGAYKRKIQMVTFGVALTLTLIIGADTLAFGDALFREPSLRAAVTGTGLSVAAANPATSGTGTPSTGAVAIRQQTDQLSKLGFPVGWATLPEDGTGWIKKVIGLLITTLAVSLGAPFWFDILKNFSNLRSSGPPPSTTTVASATVATTTTK